MILIISTCMWTVRANFHRPRKKIFSHEVHLCLHVTAKSCNDFSAPLSNSWGHDVIKKLRDARTAAKFINEYGKAEHVMRVLRNRKINHNIATAQTYERLLIETGRVNVREISYDTVVVITKMASDLRIITLIVGFIPTSSINPFYRHIILCRSLFRGCRGTCSNPLSWTCFFGCGDNAEQKHWSYDSESM
jgi:hypothetical protein